ncbi:MAG TPA: glycoside hydrolase family 3 protein [Anaerolineae bacterium]|nr:glycoside hydrolase family 3 protein [Anaerolineae bacterium]
MRPSLENIVGQKLMWSFRGQTPPPDFLAAVRAGQVSGLTLFRSMNLDHPTQIHELIDALQRAAREAHQPLLLIGVDQEGGTLLAVPGTTRFPGSLALGATRSAELAQRAGFALGRELAALGINIDYAPVCDVINNPQNPVVGPRSFGANPLVVAQLSAAMIQGLQAAGVAASAKHFPGHGDSSTDSHHGMDVLPHDEARLRAIEFVPFKVAIQTGVKMIMTAHVALPNFDDGYQRPATLSPRILKRLLRDELKFGGVVISDAMDMQAVQQGPLHIVEMIAGAQAGLDLLLLTSFVDQSAIYDALLLAARHGLLNENDLRASVDRIATLKQWVAAQSAAQPPPDLSVIGCAEHVALAYEIAERSITLVRDDPKQLPLHPKIDETIVVIVPQPKDLTPADTSSYDKPALAEAIRAYHDRVEEIVMPIEPTEADIAAIADRVAGVNRIIVGTINAYQHRGQLALINTLIDRDKSVIAIALRMPYDVGVYSRVPTCLCTYSLQPASLQAVAKVLWGQRAAAGQLPVQL